MSTSRYRLFVAPLFCALATWTADAAQTYETTLERTLTATASGHLAVNLDRGNIIVHTEDRSDVGVKLTLTVRRGTKTRADEIFAAYELATKQDKDSDTIEGHIKKRTLKFNENLDVVLHVSLPKDYNLEAATMAGSIKIGDLDGKVIAKTSSGNIDCARIGKDGELSTQAGSIHVDLCEGELKASSGSGNIEMGTVKGALHADTAAGSIKVAATSGRATLKSGGGNIEAGELGGPATAISAAGSIRVRKALAECTVRTGSGNIHVDEAQAGLHLHSSAGSVAAKLSGQPEKDCELSTDSGNVNATYAASLNLKIVAHSSAGSVRANTSAGASKRQGAVSDYSATVNKGGPALVLKTDAGSIQLDES